MTFYYNVFLIVSTLCLSARTRLCNYYNVIIKFNLIAVINLDLRLNSKRFFETVIANLEHFYSLSLIQELVNLWLITNYL